MVRTEISLFLKNVPGELGRLSALLGANGVNIDALMIQDASSYVQQLFQARGKSLQRIASAASYSSMSKDSAEFALIRMLTDNTDKAVGLLSENEYIFDLMPVVALQLENRPENLPPSPKNSARRASTSTMSTGRWPAPRPSASSCSARRTSTWRPRSSSKIAGGRNIKLP